jgi:hypothetical protein
MWESGTDRIIGVRVTDTDAKSNRSKQPVKVLAAHGREKKEEVSRGMPRTTSSFEQRRHVTPTGGPDRARGGPDRVCVSDGILIDKLGRIKFRKHVERRIGRDASGITGIAKASIPRNWSTPITLKPHLAHGVPRRQYQTSFTHSNRISEVVLRTVFSDSWILHAFNHLFRLSSWLAFSSTVDKETEFMSFLFHRSR